MAGIVVVMGPTGAGKSVQAGLLAKATGGEHLSSGELLRHDSQDAALMAAGELVPDADVERVIGRAVEETPVNKNIVLDGFPRTIAEAEWLGRQLEDWNRDLERVVVLDVPEIVTRERLARRSRNDDSLPAQREKWRDYKEQTWPVIEHYRQAGIVAEVDGVGEISEVARRVAEVL